MIDQPIDAETDRLVRYLLAKAHMMSVWEAPRVSKRAEILKDCAKALSDSQRSMPQSEFDKLMK